MSKLIRSVLEKPRAAHTLENCASLSKSMLTVILYFSDIKPPPLTVQLDLFDSLALESDKRAGVEHIHPTGKRRYAEYQEHRLVF